MADAQKGKKLTVLWANDVTLLVGALARPVENQYGCGRISCQSVGHVFNVLEKNPPVDLMVLDSEMRMSDAHWPGADPQAFEFNTKPLHAPRLCPGVKLAQLIRAGHFGEQYRHVPIIITSAFDLADDDVAAIAAMPNVGSANTEKIVSTVQQVMDQLVADQTPVAPKAYTPSAKAAELLARAKQIQPSPNTDRPPLDRPDWLDDAAHVRALKQDVRYLNNFLTKGR